MNNGPLLKEEDEKLFVNVDTNIHKEEIPEKKVEQIEEKLKVSDTYPDLKTFKESVSKQLNEITSTSIVKVKENKKSAKSLITTGILGVIILALFGTMIANFGRGIKYRNIINAKLAENIENNNKPKIQKK